jgi:hypothetical protein
MLFYSKASPAKILLKSMLLVKMPLKSMPLTRDSRHFPHFSRKEYEKNSFPG